MSEILIGIIGFKGSGKSTISKILKDKYNFEIDSFAKPVKDIAQCIFNWDRDMLEGETIESREWRETIDVDWSTRLDKYITPRKILELIGTEFGRYLIHGNIWIESLLNRIKNKKRVVISDVRFENEINSITSKGGIIIKIIRKPPSYYDEIKHLSQHDANEYMSKYYKGVHVSEYSVCNYNVQYEINNKEDNNFDYLEEQIKHIIDSKINKH